MIMTKASQFIVSFVVFISMLPLGMYVGTPIAVQVYNLTIPTEVQELFILMPFVYFFASVPLCLLSGYCFRYVAVKRSITLNASYILFCMVTVSTIFYGIGVSSYYG
jgi:hypothetical protein